MEKLIDNGYLPVTTSMSKAEMFFGAHKKGWGNKRIEKLVELFESLQVFPFTSKSSEIYGIIRAKLVREGLDIGFADTSIGSIAIENECSLLTGNLNHFNRISNLNIISFEL